MIRLNVMLGAAGHLPNGATEADFEALYEQEIKPLVRALNAFPRINIVFHYSGVVLHWIERRHPELFMLMEDLLSRKQAEFIGGGFYNPLLPLLPQTDKIGQIEMLTTYLRKLFGKRPQGCRFPALAWEQSLVGPLSSCGMNYTFLDERQFLAAGAKPNKAGLFYPCVTEDQGKIITVFPVAHTLGRQLQESGAAAVLENLAGKLSGEEFPVMLFPFAPAQAHTYEAFLQELSAADPCIDFTTTAKVYRNIRHLKRGYFPGIRACPAEDKETSPRQFLADYPEASGIYAKMLQVHTLITNRLKGDKTRKRTALEELWKAQDSAVFSLGSPGFFHAPVRKAAYSSLLVAEKITREKGKFAPSLSIFDFDLDGEKEYLFQDDRLNCYLRPHGGGIFELDYLPASWNYLDTLAQGKKRNAFVDWLAPPEISADDSGPDGIPGGHFCGDLEYEAAEADRVRRRLCFRLPARTQIPFGEIEIEKTWHMKKNAIALEYILKNSKTTQTSFVFCPQIDLSFHGGGENLLRILVVREGVKEAAAFDEAVTITDTKSLEFQDIKNEALIALEANRAFDARIFHVRTEPDNYQSTCIMPFFLISLDGEKSWRTAFSLRINS